MSAAPFITIAMLVAGRYPVVGQPLGIGRLLFATVLLHLAAARFHALVRRDDVFPSMAGFELGERAPRQTIP